MSKIQEQAIGSDLFIMTGGQVGTSVDANAEARGEKAVGNISTLGKWDKMLRTDGTVAAGWRAMSSLLEGVTFTIDANPKCDERVKEYAANTLFETPKKKFNAYASQIWRAIKWGFAPQEITVQFLDGLWYLADLGERRPRTFDFASIRRDEQTGWYSATQRYYSSSGTKSAQFGNPGSPGCGWLLWPVYGEDGTPFGESILRSIYYIHEGKNDGLKAMRLTIQRLNGTPTLAIQPGYNPDDDSKKDAAEDLALLRNHERSAIILPDWSTGEVKWTYPADNSISQAIEAIRYFTIEILCEFQAQWIARGTLATHGTQSANESDTREGRNIRAAFLRWLENQVQPLLDYLVEYNFGPQRYYPSLKCTYVEELSAQDLVGLTIQSLTAGIIKQGERREIEQYLRRAMNLPDMPEENIEVKTTAGGPLLDTVGGVQAALMINDSISAGKLTPATGSILIQQFFKVDKAIADSMITAQPAAAPMPTEQPSTTPVPSGEIEAEETEESEEEETDEESGAEKMVARRCSCGRKHSFEITAESIAQAENTPPDVPEKSGIRQAPKPGGQEQRTGPGGRPLSAIESKVDWRACELTFTNGEENLSGELRSVRTLFATYIVETLIDSDTWIDSNSLAYEIGQLELPPALAKRADAEITGELTWIKNQGEKSIRQERMQQGVESVDFSASPTGSEDADAYVEQTASLETESAWTDVKNQLARFMLKVIASAKSDIKELFRQSITELDYSGADKSATMISTEVFAKARESYVAAIEDEIGDNVEAIWYSAVLDSNTCKNCEEADRLHNEDTGEPIMPGSPEHAEFMPPYQECLGGWRCRCMLIYQWKKQTE